MTRIKCAGGGIAKLEKKRVQVEKIAKGERVKAEEERAKQTERNGFVGCIVNEAI